MMKTKGYAIIEVMKKDDQALHRFASRARRSLAPVDPRDINVRVDRRGQWFVLKGRVASQRHRTSLFEAVPRKDGAQWIIDGIEVGCEGGDDDARS
jgi:hypothetical protein